jgi:hypothetical protein
MKRSGSPTAISTRRARTPFLGFDGEPPRAVGVEALQSERLADQALSDLAT